MRILLLTAASLAALTAAPAMAQSSYPGPGYNGGYGYARPAAPSPWQIRSMIDAAERRSEISREVAQDLRAEADDLIRLQRRSTGYGYDQDSRREVNRRSFRLLAELRRARGDNGYDDSEPRYGNGYRPAPQGGYGQPGYRPAPRDDERTAPSPDGRYGAPPQDDRYGAPPQDDPNYAPGDDGPDDEDGAPPPDDGDDR